MATTSMRAALAAHIRDVAGDSNSRLSVGDLAEKVVLFVRDNGWELSGYQLGAGRERELASYVGHLLACGLDDAAVIADRVVAGFNLED